MRDIDGIFALFDRMGDHSYGEAVTQREHALQTALFAQSAGEGDAMIAAALLHDIGQLLDGAGDAAEREGRDARHEVAGAAWLGDLLPEAVLAPIRLHVAAKRYLCAVEPDYLATMSAASVLSLRLQGGPYAPAEAEAFAALPFAAEAVRLRRYDDGGKDTEAAVPALETYRPLLESLRL